MKDTHFLMPLALMFFSIIIFGQSGRYDAKWILGSDSSTGGTEIDFNASPPQIKHILEKSYEHDGANTSISNSNGELQFYSNGCFALDRANNLMENGDSLSPGFVQDGNFCSEGNPVTQSILALPTMNYNIFHLLVYRFDPLWTDPDNSIPVSGLLWNLIDMTENNGLGKVVKKGIPIQTDTIGSNYLTACRHGNGRDWWVVSPEFNSNCYLLTQLSDSGAVQTLKQCLGSKLGKKDWIGQACFSPDGKKYARFHWEYGLVIFDFDRCTGLFSNPIIIPKWETFQRAGVAFSPNSRYLYTTYHIKLFQFDLKAADIAASKTLIGEYDGFNTPYPTRFFMMGLAPDNKIYIGPPGQSKHFHIIHQPDSAGVACQFEQHGLELATSNFWSFPNFAHYRLGPDSACSTISIKTEPEERPSFSIEIQPNPASSEMEISWPTSISYNDFQLKITNLLAQPLLVKSVVGGHMSIDVSSFPTGPIVIQIIENGMVRAVRRAMIMH